MRIEVLLIQFPDFFFYFLCTFGIELILIWGNLAKKAEKLAGMSDGSLRSRLW